MTFLRKIGPIFILALLWACDPIVDDCSISALNATVVDERVTVEVEVASNLNPIQYNWSFSDGFQIATSTPVVERLTGVPGDFIATVEVELENGQVCVAEVGYTVSNDVSQSGCDIDIEGYYIEGQRLSLSVNAQDDSNVQYFILTEQNEGTWGSDTALSYLFSTGGFYDVWVGYSGDHCSDTTALTVYIPSCSLSYDILPTIIGKQVELDLDFGFPYSTTTAYTWDMGDGNYPLTTSSSAFIYTYTQSGTYQVTVTAKTETCIVEEEIMIVVY